MATPKKTQIFIFQYFTIQHFYLTSENSDNFLARAVTLSRSHPRGSIGIVKSLLPPLNISLTMKYYNSFYTVGAVED